MRVLVIEDSFIDFCLVERALGGQFLLSRESTLAGGLHAAVRDQVDLVILDLTLEDSIGYHTFQKAHAALPWMPILVLSGIDDEELALRAVRDGAQDYVRKSRLLDYPLDRAARYAIERKRSDRKLHESERFAKSIVNSLPDHMAILDESGVVVGVNTAWQRFADANGLTMGGHGIGANYLSVCEQADRDDVEFATRAAAGIRAVIRGERREFSLEYPCHSPTEERWFSMRVTPFDGDGPTRVVVAHENITVRTIADRLAIEKIRLREAVCAMEQVLGVVGHELRTPLAALRAISEFLTTDGARDTPEADRFMKVILNEVDRMSDTVNNLLEAARLNSGRARWNWSDVRLGDVIDDAVQSIQPLIDANRVQLDVRIDPTDQQILGDPDAIRRLLINLLSNARKHTTDGHIEVLGHRYTDADGEWFELTVRDTGCGIPPEISARLGEAFALNSGVVGLNHVGGTGLGLAICTGIATAHGGHLLIDSTPGRGTTVTARLRADLQSAATGETRVAEFA